MKFMEGDSDMDAKIHQVSKAQRNNKVTNALNADCWHLILDYLSVKELMRTEATCKDWQKLVLAQISYRHIVVHGSSSTSKNTLSLSKSCWPSFKRWLKKCGRSITEFEPGCYYKDVVEVLGEHCPNLERLKLQRLKKRLSLTNTLHFPKLNSVTFQFCDELTDDCVSQFLTSNLKQLCILYNKRVTGRFLNSLKNDKLKFLELKHCRAFKFPFLLSAVERLSNVVTLVFWKRNRSKIEIRSKLHILLDNMPKLTTVSFQVYDILNKYDETRSLEESDVFFESLCRLDGLLSIEANFQVWDQHLEALGRSCKETTVVHLNFEPMTPRGLNSLCGLLGPRLRELSLWKSHVMDDNVVALVYACHSLIYLDISECHHLESAVQRVAAARRDLRANSPSLMEHLTLVVRRWDFSGNTDELKDVIQILYASDLNTTCYRQY